MRERGRGKWRKKTELCKTRQGFFMSFLDAMFYSGTLLLIECTLFTQGFNLCFYFNMSVEKLWKALDLHLSFHTWQSRWPHLNGKDKNSVKSLPKKGYCKTRLVNTSLLMILRSLNQIQFLIRFNVNFPSLCLKLYQVDYKTILGRLGACNIPSENIGDGNRSNCQQIDQQTACESPV